MMDFEKTNRAKIPKVVYLLVQKYHRLHGLATVGWSKQPGNLYFSFYCMGIRNSETGRPNHLPEVGGQYSLTIYQDSVGLPAWGTGDRNKEHPDWRDRELRSAEMLDWYEEQLSLVDLFSDYNEAIENWRRAYHVAESERFLLTWNTIGICSSTTDSKIFTYGCSDQYYEVPPEEKEAVLELGASRPTEEIVFCQGMAFGLDGRARLPDGRIIDLWSRSLSGQRPKQIATELLDLVSKEKVHGS
jgi:hypothetical protein